VYDPHEDPHCFDANPDLDLDRHQQRIRSGIKTMMIHNTVYNIFFLYLSLILREWMISFQYLSIPTCFSTRRRNIARLCAKICCVTALPPFPLSGEDDENTLAAALI
jgi:hypothetical protein